jgi:hypothetical protein
VFSVVQIFAKKLKQTKSPNHGKHGNNGRTEKHGKEED